MRRSLALFALGVTLGGSGPVTASAGAGVPAAPHLLPGDAAAASVRAAPGTWLVGARPGRASAQIARRQGARRLGLGLYAVTRARARALVAGLRAAGRYSFSEPDVLFRPQLIQDPLMLVGSNWRDFVADPQLVPPAVTPASPLLAIIDSQLDLSQSEWQGGNVSSASTAPAGDLHGTAVASAAGAPQNGLGVVGVWPGMRIEDFPVSFPASCSDVVVRIGEAISAGASVINMSMGSSTYCFTQFVQLEFAVAKGILPVAAAGNEFAEGNPIEFPASLPHVFTVAAIGPDLKSALFSNENPGVDASAPGAGVIAAVPLAFDDQPPRDGYMLLDGTSFAAPIAAAAATWLRAARPDLDGYQAGELLRETAVDLGPAGWDTSTGWGLVNVGRALPGASPSPDIGEPNDDIEWVNGRRFGRPDRPVWRGGTRLALTSLLDKFEDQTDLYRVVLPARSSVRITLKSVTGNADLAVFDNRARRVGSDRGLIDDSVRGGSALDSSSITNPARAKTSLYVDAYIKRSERALTSVYRLTVARVRYRP